MKRTEQAMTQPDFPPICAATLAEWKAARRRVLKVGAKREAVHNLRIQMRRLLALEALLAPREGEMQAALQDVLHASGRLRDAQLVASEMRNLAGAMPQVRQLADRQRKRRPRLTRRLCRDLRAVRPAQLARIVAGWLQPQRGNPRTVLARRAASRLRERLGRTRATGRSTSPHGLHQHRLRLKELRYMAGLAAAAGCALPGLLSLEQLAEQQNRLGAVTDIDMLLRKVARHATKHPDWRSSALELKRELRRQRAAALRNL
jgi:CHAD domain-containing protein